MDRDGFISNGELYLVLKMMVGNNLKVRIVIKQAHRNPHTSRRAQEQQLQQIVDKTIMEGDRDGSVANLTGYSARLTHLSSDGKLNFEEFKTMVTDTVDYLQPLLPNYADQPHRTS